MKSAVLSKELGRVWTDYNQGADVRNALVLCISWAKSLERELDVYRQCGVMEEQAKYALRTARSIEESGSVIHADFKSKESGNE